MAVANEGNYLNNLKPAYIIHIMLNRLRSALTPHSNQDVLPMWKPDYPLCSSVVTVVH